MFNVSSQENVYGDPNCLRVSSKEENYTDYMDDAYIPTILTVDALRLMNNTGKYNLNNDEEENNNVVINDTENEKTKDEEIKKDIDSENISKTSDDNLPSVINDHAKIETPNKTNSSSNARDSISKLIKGKFVGAAITERFVNNLTINGEVVFGSEEITALKRGDSVYFINTDYIASFE
jgi:molybdopterin converting factor small subunit